MVHVPDHVAAEAGLPEDLDSTRLGPYSVPDSRRRARAGLFYLGGAALVVIGIIAGRLPAGMWWAVGLLLVIGGLSLAGAWRIQVDERQALAVAAPLVPFAVGHAGATVSFVGWRARPTWNVLLFSADEPPTQRGLVRVDAVSGEVRGTWVEPNPI